MTQATRIRTCPHCKRPGERLHHSRLNDVMVLGPGCWIKLGYSKERGQSWLRVWHG